MKSKQVELLLFGYSRDPTNDDNLLLTEDIIYNICIKYVVRTIDYFKQFHGALIDYDNNLFQVNPSDTKPIGQRNTYCISHYRWNKGKHEMMIQILTHDYHQNGLSIDIVSKLNIITNRWLFDSPNAGETCQFYFEKNKVRVIYHCKQENYHVHSKSIFINIRSLN